MLRSHSIFDFVHRIGPRMISALTLSARADTGANPQVRDQK